MAAHAAFGQAAQIGARFNDADLIALARHGEGRMLLRLDRDVATVVWSTGFRPGFSWIDLPVFGLDGEPLHERGIVTSEPGLSFVGLRFLYAHSPRR